MVATGEPRGLRKQRVSVQTLEGSTTDISEKALPLNSEGGPLQGLRKGSGEPLFRGFTPTATIGSPRRGSWKMFPLVYTGWKSSLR
jgi:hypothetical protein